MKSRTKICRPITLLKVNSFKGSSKDFANIKSHFFLCFYSLGTASYKERLSVTASVPTMYEINKWF